MRRSFLQGVAQQAVLVGFDRVEAGEDHGLDFLETGQWLGGGIPVIDDGVPDLGVGDGLDIGEEEADLAGGELVARSGFGRLVAQAFHVECLAVGPEPDLLPEPQPAVHDAREDDDAAVGIEPGIEDEGAEGSVGRAFGRRHQVDDVLENVVYAGALLGAGEDGVPRIQSDDGLDLLADALGLGGGQVDFIDDRDDFQVVVQRQVGVGEGLRFHALRGVHHQQRALAGLQAAGDLVGEIHVAGGVDEVQLIPVAVVGAVIEADGVGLDGDAALALQVHGVEHLLHHFALGKRPGDFEQTVRQRGLAVIDVRDDREIPDEFAVHAVGRALPIIPQGKR